MTNKNNKIRKKELVDFFDDYLIENIAELQLVNKGTRKKAFHDLIEELINYLKGSLNKGYSVEIRGFGSLKRVLRKGKKGRKVKTGELVEFPDYYDIKLKIAKGFKSMLNED
jgi:nucleoid DNA-binding protein